jgi:hypothetical protein
VLAAHRGTLDALAHALLKAESLNAQEIRDVTGLCDTPAHLQEHSARYYGSAEARTEAP